jgi:hypothetical protein
MANCRRPAEDQVAAANKSAAVLEAITRAIYVFAFLGIVALSFI